MTDFAHLHLHTEYSTLDGFGTVEAYAKQAQKYGYKYLACTDHGNIDGLIKFQQACQKYEVKPIFGCELYIVPKLEKTRTNGHILLLVKNRKGFSNLCRLLTFANQKGFYYKPRITYNMLLKYCQGLIISTACMQSFINLPTGEELTEKLIDKIGNDFYFEVMPHNTPKQHTHNKKVIKWAKHYGRQVILTNDCHYIQPGDATVQELLLAIQRKAKWDDPQRFKFTIRTLSLKSKPKMLQALRKCSSISNTKYLSNTIQVAEKCADFAITKRKVKLPKVNSVKGTEANHLQSICNKNFQHMFGQTLFSQQEYYNRFNLEFDLIKSKGFVRYFLIVHDLINYCRAADIPIGPGRGSVGCCLIAYLLRITIIDPVKWHLPIDRFINKDRVDYPDIDIDFAHNKRHLVIDYLVKKYGENKVAEISTFSRLKSRAVIQDVARIFEIPPLEVNTFTKYIDQKAENALRQVIRTAEGREFKRRHPKVVKYALKLEGQIRGKSKHAAGIVINNRPIATSGKCNLIQRDGSVMVNWEKEDTEYMGLMKLDILGLKFLSIIGECTKLIEQNHNKKIDLEAINLEDPTVLQQISNGNTVGLFQLNPYATTRVVKEMGIDSFSDIVAAVALSRPGPANSGMTNEYIARKKGKYYEKKKMEYEQITANTYGLFIYQEQIMSAIHKIAGLPYSTADKIRKIIGKKRNPKEFAKYQKQFMRGCRRTGIFTTSEAKDFWSGLSEWAMYGFNLAHSIEYGMLGYWSAWLKHYYPTEFICASLTYGAKEKKKEILEEAYRLDLQIVLPMVFGQTHATDWLAKDGKLYIPFVEVKSIGPKKALEAKRRPQKPAQDLLLGSVKENEINHKGKFKEKLQSLNAYRTNEYTPVTQAMRSQFDFRITASPKEEYPKLYDLLGEIPLRHLDALLTGDYKALRRFARSKKLFHAVRSNIFSKKFKRQITKCKNCDLHLECTKPVLMSTGKANISTIAEAPGYNEDQQGQGLVGPAGVYLWQVLQQFKLHRAMFHVSNLNKCYPQATRTPKQQHMDACTPYLKTELRRIKPKVILIMGNNCRYFFTGAKTGITKVNGTTTWSEQFACWLCFAIHPSAVLHRGEKKEEFEFGIRNFSRTLTALGFKKWYNKL